MIFPNLLLEPIVQVNDKFRMNASKVFTTPGETVTDVEIEAEALAGYVSIFNVDSDKWYLDWAYETDGDKVVSLRVTTDMGTKTQVYAVTALTEVEDKLFSNDNDIYPYEPDISRYLPRGKSSWLYAHREAQTKIIEFLDEQRIWKLDGSAFTKEDLVTIDEFRRWSLFQTLLIIFESIQLNTGDIFQEKRDEYEKGMIQARNRASLRLDRNGDGTNDPTPYNVRTTRMVRR